MKSNNIYNIGIDRIYLRAILDVMTLIKAEMAQVVRWRSLAGLAWLRGQGEVGEVVRERVQPVHDVVQRAIWRNAFI